MLETSLLSKLADLSNLPHGVSFVDCKTVDFTVSIAAATQSVSDILANTFNY